MSEEEEKKKIDCRYTDQPTCPYCGYENDGDFIDDNTPVIDCLKCEKQFAIETDYTRYFTSSKTCQLNDSHDYGEWEPYIKNEKEFRQCNICHKYDYRNIKT